MLSLFRQSLSVRLPLSLHPIQVRSILLLRTEFAFLNVSRSLFGRRYASVVYLSACPVGTTRPARWRRSSGAWNSTEREAPPPMADGGCSGQEEPRTRSTRVAWKQASDRPTTADPNERRETSIRQAFTARTRRAAGHRWFGSFIARRW